jgi:hypothetical protein
MTGLYRTEKIRLLEAGLCAAFIGLDIWLIQGWAAVPAMAAVLSWQLAVVGRKSRYRWPSVLALVVGLGTNIAWLAFFNRIVISPLLCSLVGLETHRYLDRLRTWPR